MKKSILGFVLAVFCLAIPFSASAKTSGISAQDNSVHGKGYVTFSKAPITDVKTLFKIAKEGKSGPTKLPINANADYTDLKTGKKSDLKTYKVTQHTKTTKYNDGLVVNQYQTTIIAAASQNFIGSGSSSGTAYDPAYSIKASGTIYYNKYNYTGDTTTYYDMTKMTGSWTLNSRDSVYNKYYVYGQNGYTYNNNFVNQSSSYIYLSDSTYSFTDYPPSSWTPVRKGGTSLLHMDMGINTYGTVGYSDGSTGTVHLQLIMT